MAVLSVAAKKSKAKQKKGSPSGGEGDSKALESMEVVSVPVHVLTNDHMSLIDLTCTVHVHVIDPVVHVHVWDSQVIAMIYPVKLFSTGLCIHHKHVLVQGALRCAGIGS